jgi:hypothetical protein
LLVADVLEQWKHRYVPVEEARRVAYAIAMSRWHERYGPRPDPHRCAGCGRLISASQTVDSLPRRHAHS